MASNLRKNLAHKFIRLSKKKNDSNGRNGGNCENEGDYFVSKPTQTIIVQASQNQSVIGMKNLWTTRELSDLVIACQNEEFKVHRIVLALQSDYFHRKLIDHNEEDVTVIRLNESPSVVAKCIEFMYTGITEIGISELDDLALVAEKLEIEDLRSLCRGMSLSTTAVTDENCLELWNEGIKLQNPEMIGNAKQVALSSFADLNSQREERVAALTWICVSELLSHENLHVSSVEERLTEALGWFRTDTVSRIQYLPEMLRALPLSEMSGWFLGHVRRDPVFDLSAEAKVIIDDALNHVK